MTHSETRFLILDSDLLVPADDIEPSLAYFDDIPPDGYKTISGEANKTLTRCTWRNVNLRAVMGENWWRENEYFGIRLVRIARRYLASVWQREPNDGNIALLMSGISFFSTVYENKGLMAIFNMPESNDDFFLYSPEKKFAPLAFRKPNDTVDITLDFAQVSDLSQHILLNEIDDEGSLALGTAEFIFEIVRLPKESGPSTASAQQQARKKKRFAHSTDA